MNSDLNVNLNKIETMIIDSEKDQIFTHLANEQSIVFKLQQRNESDLTVEEKMKIASDLYDKSKLSFLMRFGKNLNPLHLDHFKNILGNSEEANEVEIILNDLQRNSSKSHDIDVKNRRYEALQQLIKENSYFSEVEMMKRNPLLYEQLVGQYLTEEEKHERDKYKKSDLTLVKVLLEGIERENAKLTQKAQEDLENSMMEEEEDSDEEDEEMDGKVDSPQPSTSTKKWGEFEEDKRPTFRNAAGSLTEAEREILKEEFVTTMYQHFLDGKDKEFNYDEVDNNSKYDNASALDQDAEDKYFDSEEPENVDTKTEDQSSEDELDIYMNALNQHPTVLQLAKDVNKL